MTALAVEPGAGVFCPFGEWPAAPDPDPQRRQPYTAACPACGGDAEWVGQQVRDHTVERWSSKTTLHYSCGACGTADVPSSV